MHAGCAHAPVRAVPWLRFGRVPGSACACAVQLLLDTAGQCGPFAVGVDAAPAAVHALLSLPLSSTAAPQGKAPRCALGPMHARRPELQARHTAFQRGSAYLERYCMLIAFAAYLELCQKRGRRLTFEVILCIIICLRLGGGGRGCFSW